MHSTFGRGGSSHPHGLLNIAAKTSLPEHHSRLCRGLAGARAGNDVTMASTAEQEPAHPLWVEAVGAVQADHDVDIRLEARGLVVAEMADVTFADRMAAVQPGSQVAITIRGGERITGIVELTGADFLVLRAPGPRVVPVNAIAGTSSLPRVLHEERTTTPPRARTVTWRSIMRELLGESIQIESSGTHFTGRLTWVGADHVSLTSEGPDCVEVTIRWDRLDSVVLPAAWEVATELR